MPSFTPSFPTAALATLPHFDFPKAQALIYRMGEVEHRLVQALPQGPQAVEGVRLTIVSLVGEARVLLQPLTFPTPWTQDKSSAAATWLKLELSRYEQVLADWGK